MGWGILLVRATTLLGGIAVAAMPIATSARSAAQSVASLRNAADVQNDVYRLGPGDKVKITVYNEDTLSGEYEVDGAGMLALQLVGSIPVLGRSVPEVTAMIVDKLKEGYMRNPSVAIQVLNYRPFYVLGEVKEPGKYPYVNGMTVLNAIALAGGYTYRGKKGHAMVIRATDAAKKEQVVKPTDVIMPGDIIRIPERIF